MKEVWSPRLGLKCEFLPFSQGCIIFFFFFFFDIGQDCSLGQCLTSSRAETSKKSFFLTQIGA